MGDVINDETVSDDGVIYLFDGVKRCTDNRRLFCHSILKCETTANGLKKRSLPEEYILKSAPRYKKREYALADQQAYLEYVRTTANMHHLKKPRFVSNEEKEKLSGDVPNLETYVKADKFDIRVPGRQPPGDPELAKDSITSSSDSMGSCCNPISALHRVRDCM